jgi:steroid delta-isomerase-like uncharacterized protein
MPYMEIPDVAIEQIGQTVGTESFEGGSNAKESEMSAEDNKNINLRWIQAFNERDWTAESTFRTTDYQAHMSASPVPLDSAGWAAFMTSFTTAFPDAQIAVEASIAERDVVVSRWTISGTHLGNFLGVPASGRQISMQGIDFSRVVDGKIAEHWAQFDVMAVMQQIGAVPTPA